MGCVDDRSTNITQKCIKLTIPWTYGSSKCLLPHEHPGIKWENMVAFATKIPQISSPDTVDTTALYPSALPISHIFSMQHKTSGLNTEYCVCQQNHVQAVSPKSHNYMLLSSTLF